MTDIPLGQWIFRLSARTRAYTCCWSRHPFQNVFKMYSKGGGTDCANTLQRDGRWDTLIAFGKTIIRGASVSGGHDAISNVARRPFVDASGASYVEPRLQVVETNCSSHD
jgi:hypothetical protein